MSTKKRILVVEDHADIRKLIRMTLDFGDYEVHEAENGETGLRMVTTLRPDLVLLDVMMPGELDGFQVCSQIKQDPAIAHTKVAILTARGQQTDLEHGKQANCDAYLTKPFSPLELIDSVESLLARGARQT